MVDLSTENINYTRAKDWVRDDLLQEMENGMNLGFWDWTAAIIASLAWPLTALFVAKAFKKELSALMARVVSLKLGSMEFTAAQSTRMNQEASSARSINKGVIREGRGSGWYWRQYGNGQIVQAITLLMKAGRGTANITFPIAFPFEVTSILPVGNVGLKVENLTESGCELHIDPSNADREIRLIIGGL